MTTVTLDLSEKEIAYQVIAALEGGSNYWLHAFELVTRGNTDIEEKPWYANPALYTPGANAIFAVDYDPPTEQDPGHKPIDYTDFARGAQLMASKSPRHFANILSDNADAETADVFMQYVVFGGIVFG